MKPYPALVRWVDSCDIGPATWLEPEVLSDETVSPVTIVSVGWLLSRNKERLVLSLSVAEHGDVRGAFTIPSSCVVEVVKLGSVS